MGIALSAVYATLELGNEVTCVVANPTGDFNNERKESLPAGVDGFVELVVGFFLLGFDVGCGPGSMFQNGVGVGAGFGIYYGDIDQ